MSDKRFQPSRNNPNQSNSINNNRASTPRLPVPTSRPVPRSNVPVEQEEQQMQFQEQRITVPVNQRTPLSPFGGGQTFEEQFTQEKELSNRSTKKRKLIIGGAVVAVLIGALFGVTYLGSNGKVPFVDSSQITGTTSNPLLDTTTNKSSSTFKFDGNPVPVKWPSDVKPTRMEVQLDPNTSDPVLLLIGDKQGLGTVLRSYDRSGSLTGFWVIVPDDATNVTNNTNQQQQSNQQPQTPAQQQQSNQQPQTPAQQQQTNQQQTKTQ